jgi:hypothetical protein
MISSPQQGRANILFEARENRFRFVYTDIAVLYADWQPIAMRNSKSDDRITAGLDNITQKVTACIRIKPAKSADW